MLDIRVSTAQRPNGPTPLQHDLKIKLFNENLKLVLPFGKKL